MRWQSYAVRDIEAKGGKHCWKTLARHAARVVRDGQAAILFLSESSKHLPHINIK